MKPLLLLALAACAQSWPQLSFNSNLPRDAEPAGPSRDARGRLPVVDDDIDVVTLPVSRPQKGQKRQLPVDEDLDMSSLTLPVSTRPSVRRRQLHDDVEIPVLRSSGPSAKRVLDAKRGLVGSEEGHMARQLFDDTEVPSLHSSAPGRSKRAVEVGGRLAGRLGARQLHDEDIEIPVLSSSGPSRRAVEDNGGLTRSPNAEKEARQVHSDDVEIPVLSSSGPGSRRAIVKERVLSGAPRAGRKDARQPPVDEDLGMSAVTLPVSPREGGPRAERKARQFLTDDIDVPSMHSSGPGARKRIVKERQLPVEDLEMSAMTLPVTRTTGPRDTQNARQLPEDDVGPGVLTLPVVHSTRPGVWRRAVEVELANRSDVAYYAQLNLGTPPQPVFVQLDTGSFELWVNPDCGSVSERDAVFCEAVGYYDTKLSSTSSATEGNQTLRYGIGAANITYVRDSIGLPGSPSTLRDVQFGVATSSEDQFAGILGLGHGQPSTANRTFLDALVSQNITPTRAFALGLGGKNDQEGVVTFGGVDTSKFAGGLAPVPLIPAEDAPDGVPRYWVQLEGIMLSPPGGGTARPYAGSRTPVFLDSGATLTLLPPELAAAIAEDFGVGEEDADGFYAVDCGLVGMEGSLDFAFEGVTVRVPYREMIRELRNPPSCYLGIVPSEEFTLLGDTFLRSSYVVFDPDDKMTYIAQYQNCGSTVTPLATTDTIPALYGVCGLAGTSAPSAPAETDAEEEQTGGAGRAGLGLWVFAVGVVWLL